MNTKNKICCFPETQIFLGILYFYLLILASLLPSQVVPMLLVCKLQFFYKKELDSDLVLFYNYEKNVKHESKLKTL